MTLGKLIETSLDRTGLDPDLTDYKNQARDYANIAIKLIELETTWRWLFKTGTITTADGTRSYSLATGVMLPRSFRNVTDDSTMQMMHPEEVDELDPDDDESGDSGIVAITGVNDTTGLWDVDIIGTPDAVETIKYRYYATFTEWTSSNDATDLLALGVPPWIQPALLTKTTQLYKEQKGDPSSPADEKVYDRLIKDAKRANGNLTTDVRERFRRPSDGYHGRAPFQPQEGSLT